MANDNAIRTHFGEPHLPPPYKAEGAKAFLYVIKSQKPEEVEQQIVRPSLGAEFTPKLYGLPGQKHLFFIAGYLHYDSLISEENLRQTKETRKYSYKESVIYLPVESKLTGKVYWFIPSIHLDSNAPMLCGREFYGFPKSIGSIEMLDEHQGKEDRSGNEDLLSRFLCTKTEVLKRCIRNGKTELVSEKDTKIMAASQTGAGAIGDKLYELKEHKGRIDHEEFVTQTLRNISEDYSKESKSAMGPSPSVVSGALEFTQDIVLWKFPLLFLKKVCSSEHPNKPVYQSLVEVEAQLLVPEKLRPLSWSKVYLWNHDEYRLASAMGLGDKEGRVEVIPELALWTKTSFRLGLGTERELPKEKKKIVILGGGLAGISTALQLTDPKNPKSEWYDVTVYQQGWRLGGKGASGRNLEDGKGKRIQEHGLHVWLGFYENAFRMLRKVYEEWDISGNHPWWAPEKTDRWLKAFEKSWFSSHVEPLNEERTKWEIWNLRYPRTQGTPGDGETVSRDSLLHFVSALLQWMDYFDSLIRHHEKPDQSLKKWLEEEGETQSPPSKYLSRYGLETLAPTIIRPFFLKALDRTLGVVWLGVALFRFLHLLGWKKQFNKLSDIKKKEARKVYVFLDLSQALMKGFAWNAIEILFKGLDTLDEYDLREFLRKYGAEKASAESQLIDSLYDGVFAVPEGRIKKDSPRFVGENLAAGVGLRCFMNISLRYKGAPMWKMKAGMGDTIFTPAYEVLRERGVKFKFFHRVRDLKLTPDKKKIGTIEFGIQANPNQDPENFQKEVDNGRETELEYEYNPFEKVPFKMEDGQEGRCLNCWPSEPLYSRLENGENIGSYICGPFEGSSAEETEIIKEGNLREFESGVPPSTGEDREQSGADRLREQEDRFTLTSEKDFDHVVLAIGIGAFDSICKELIAGNPRFEEMVEKIKTVRTESYQLWLNKTLEGLGWKDGSTVLGNFNDPLNTWADMTHLLAAEQMGEEVKNLSYFVGPMPDEVEGKGAGKYIRDKANDLKTELVKHFWKEARDQTGGLDPRLIVSEYFRTNITPSDRYVLSVAGSTKYRLRADESGFENLTLAGDWTRNDFNVGCVEATVMSGMMASNAISEFPKDEDINRHG